MTTDAIPIDPYEAVLADLRSKRDQLDHAIAAIEAIRTGAPSPQSVASPAKSALNLPTEGPGAFLGMTIVDAAKALLANRRQPLGNPEISAAFKAGGLVLTSADPVNTIGSVLTRRFNQVGDVVRVSRGMWGLAEWYPNRNFKRKPAGKAAFAAPSLTGGLNVTYLNENGEVIARDDEDRDPFQD